VQGELSESRPGRLDGARGCGGGARIRSVTVVVIVTGYGSRRRRRALIVIVIVIGIFVGAEFHPGERHGTVIDSAVINGPQFIGSEFVTSELRSGRRGGTGLNATRVIAAGEYCSRQRSGFVVAPILIAGTILITGAVLITGPVLIAGTILIAGAVLIAGTVLIASQLGAPERQRLRVTATMAVPGVVSTRRSAD
jgi:hypothetical protein